MLATGGLLVSIALLALAVLAPVFRSSNPPRWTTRRWIGEVVTLAIVCSLALGLTCLGAGAIGAFETGPDGLDLGLLAVVLLGSLVVWRRLSARAPAGAINADGGFHVHVPAGRGAPSASAVARAEDLPMSAREPAPPDRAA